MLSLLDDEDSMEGGGEVVAGLTPQSHFFLYASCIEIIDLLGGQNIDPFSLRISFSSVPSSKLCNLGLGSILDGLFVLTHDAF